MNFKKPVYAERIYLNAASPQLPDTINHSHPVDIFTNYITMNMNINMAYPLNKWGCGAFARVFAFDALFYVMHRVYANTLNKQNTWKNRRK